jgi:hypothetical protein
MKLKSDFVTNSSSASFIIYFNYNDKDWTFEEFRYEFLEYIQKGYIGGECCAGRHYSFPPDSIELLSDGRVKIECWTSMYNGYEDVPSYMIDLVMRSHQTKDSSDDEIYFGIKDVKFEVRGD